MAADNKDFEFQLRAEKELKTTQQLQQGDRSEGSSTYVDPVDGTIYEWDPQRRGWFPKVIWWNVKVTFWAKGVELTALLQEHVKASTKLDVDESIDRGGRRGIGNVSRDRMYLLLHMYSHNERRILAL